MKYDSLLLKTVVLLALLFSHSFLLAQEEPAAEPEASETGEQSEANGEAAAVDNKPPPVYIAAKYGKLNDLRKLIESGADINITNPHGRTSLMAAVQYQNRRVAEELIIEGADVNLKDSSGRTALMLAIQKQDMQLINLLLEAGADVTAADKNNRTAFTLAEASKDKELTKLLEAAKPAEAAE